jgi:hypothetical protein
MLKLENRDVDCFVFFSGCSVWVDAIHGLYKQANKRFKKKSAEVIHLYFTDM